MGAKLVIEGLSMNGTDAEVDRQVKTSGKTARLASSKPAKAHKVLSSRGGGGGKKPPQRPYFFWGGGGGGV